MYLYIGGERQQPLGGQLKIESKIKRHLQDYKDDKKGGYKLTLYRGYRQHKAEHDRYRLNTIGISKKHNTWIKVTVEIGLIKMRSIIGRKRN